tara:strand:+ start:91 stop:1182 length:1092 start_codon:yes stop_codon:yes gene_type:complete
MRSNEYKWGQSMIASEMNEDDEWFSQRDANIKTAKNNGGKSEETNATVLVRLAKRMNIEGHSIVDNYYKPKSKSGINVNTQLKQLQKLRYEMMKAHFKPNMKESALINTFADVLTTMTPTAEEPATKSTKFVFGEAQDGVLSGLTDDAPKATATETDGFLLDEFDIDFINENVDSAMIQEAIGKLYSVNANGKFYQYGSRSIKTTDRPEWIEKGVKAGNGNVIFNGLFRQPMADLLQVRAKAKSTLAKTEQNPKAKYKHWFTELVANKTADVKATMIKTVSYVMHHSGRNFWAKRIAWAVSPAFVESFKEYIGFNQEVADSPVMGGTAQDWHWPYEANDWESSTTESVDLSAMGLDLNDLKNL